LASGREFLRAKLGDHVPLAHGTFTSSESCDRKRFEDGGVFMPLSSAQSFFHSRLFFGHHHQAARQDDAEAFKSAVRLGLQPDCPGRRRVHPLYSQFRFSRHGLGRRRMRPGAGGLGVATT